MIAPCNQVPGSTPTLSTAPGENVGDALPISKPHKPQVEEEANLIVPAPTLDLPLIALSVGVRLFNSLCNVPGIFALC